MKELQLQKNVLVGGWRNEEEGLLRSTWPGKGVRIQREGKIIFILY